MIPKKTSEAKGCADVWMRAYNGRCVGSDSTRHKSAPVTPVSDRALYTLLTTISLSMVIKAVFECEERSLAAID